MVIENDIIRLLHEEEIIKASFHPEAAVHCSKC